MNQHQRKFLLEAVEKQYRREKDTIEKREPKEPSLNNYLTAAILDGSFVMKSPEEVRKTIFRRVRGLGKAEALLAHSRDRWGSGRGDADDQHTITLPADVLFEMPPEYAKAYAEYEEAYGRWEKEIEALDQSIEAMRIKVQIGSDKALDLLVDQADQLCSMSLTASSKLLLGTPKEGGA